MEIGDLILAYRAGIHEMVSLDMSPGKSSTGLVGYRQVFTSEGKPFRSKKIYYCDRGFCRAFTPEVAMARIAEYQQCIKQLSWLMFSSGRM